MHVPEAGPESRSTTRPRPGAFPPVAGMAAGRRCAGDTRSVRPARSRSLLAVRQPGLRRTGVRSWVVVRAEGAERSMGAARIVLGGKGRNPATSEELARCNNRRPFIWKKKRLLRTATGHTPAEHRLNAAERPRTMQSNGTRRGNNRCIDIRGPKRNLNSPAGDNSPAAAAAVHTGPGEKDSPADFHRSHRRTPGSAAEDHRSSRTWCCPLPCGEASITGIRTSRPGRDQIKSK